MKIGFIGLGNMGKPMASNLAKAGHKVTGYDITEISLQGIKMAKTPEETAEDSELVITMLPNGEILSHVIENILPAMRPGSIFLDCSTVDVDTSRKIAQKARDKKIWPLDAPVSGGVGGASAGTLTFMVGGATESFNRVKPLLDIMGKKVVHCGPSGNGQAAKICNNMILGATMIVTCEAFALADKLGLDREAMFDVVSTSSGYSWSMNVYCPAPGVGPKSPSDKNYKPGFSSDLMMKDLLLSQQAAEIVNADTPIGQTAAKLYKTFVESEDGAGKDFSAMLPRFEKRNRI